MAAKRAGAKVPDPALSNAVVPFAELVQIHQVESLAKRLDAVDRRPNEAFTVDFTHEVRAAADPEKGITFGLLKLTARGHFNGEDCLLIEATYRVGYVIKEGCALNKKDLRSAFESFCALHALPHVWPYWREFLTEASMRLGMSPIIAPLLRVNYRAPENTPKKPAAKAKA